MLRAEFPVHRNSTLYVESDMTSAGVARLRLGSALSALPALRRLHRLRRSGERLAIRPTCLVGKRTAILGQKIDDGLHALKLRAVVQISAFATAGDEAHIDQLPQVERESWRGNAETPGELCGGIAGWPTLHEQPEYRKACLRGESAQRGDCLFCFHACNDIKL